MSGDAPSKPSSQAKKKPIVLVIDDNPQYAKVFEVLAESLGITAVIVNSCTGATDLLAESACDVILMDWLMPEVDGPLCTKKIRALEAKSGKHTPIIGVTGHIMITRDMCLTAGMDDFLSVPFTYEQLSEKLTLWLKPKS